MIEASTITVKISPFRSLPLLIKMCIIWDFGVKLDATVLEVLQVTSDVLQSILMPFARLDSKTRHGHGCGSNIHTSQRKCPLETTNHRHAFRTVIIIAEFANIKFWMITRLKRSMDFSTIFHLLAEHSFILLNDFMDVSNRSPGHTWLRVFDSLEKWHRDGNWVDRHLLICIPYCAHHPKTALHFYLHRVNHLHRRLHTQSDPFLSLIHTSGSARDGKNPSFFIESAHLAW